jgi:hypothetical protein
LRGGRRPATLDVVRALLVVVAPLAVLAMSACSDDEVRPSDDAAAIDATPTDAPIDAIDVCATCTGDQLCVEFFDGTCGVFRTECQERHATCATGTACTPGCMQWQCNDGDDPPLIRCDVGGCPVENPAALHCYGP